MLRNDDRARVDRAFARRDASESDSDEDGGAGGATTRRAVPVFEIKPAGNASERAMASRSFEGFTFAPPPRASSAAEGAEVRWSERAERSGRGRSDDAGAGVGALEVNADVVASAKSGFVDGNVGVRAERTTASAGVPPKTALKPASGKPTRKKAFDPYDMLDAIVAREESSTTIDSIAVDRIQATSPPSRRSTLETAVLADRRHLSSRASGDLSPRASRTSFGADSQSQFYEELAQISLPDTDTIKPTKEFERGVSLFDANKLSEALFAFVSAAVNAAHSEDPIARKCASYATTCKILRDCSTLLVANAAECARLTRHLVALPGVEERHRRASLRFASAKNFKARNTGVAAKMIRRLIELSPPEGVKNLEAMLGQCTARGEVDENVPENEDATKICAATLESIPTTSNGITCHACGALHSTKAAFETGQCVICRSILAGARGSNNGGWF